MSQIYCNEHHCNQQTGLDLLIAIKVSVYTEDGCFPAHFAPWQQVPRGKTDETLTIKNIFF